jgi:8-oxo-dGTP pyrophosphatase MutT (NUDIX family)
MAQVVSNSVVDVYPFCVDEGQARFLSLLRAPGAPLENTWQAVHGRVEKRETIVQAAMREVVTQLGAEPLSLWNIDYVNTFYVPEEDAIYMVPSIGALVSADLIVQLTPEHVNWEWNPADTLVRRFLWIGQRLALQTLHDEIATPMASGYVPNPYLEIPESLYLRRKKGFR